MLNQLASRSITSKNRFPESQCGSSSRSSSNLSDKEHTIMNANVTEPSTTPLALSHGASDGVIKTEDEKLCTTPIKKQSPALSLLASDDSPDSLNKLMAGCSSFKAAQSAYLKDVKSTARKMDDVDFDAYGYGYGSDEKDETKKNRRPEAVRPNKRRRFERRNSKTPAMLMAMNSPLLRRLDEEDGVEKTDPVAGETKPLKDDRNWDSLKPAEDLFKSLQQQRRLSNE